jgi:cell division protein FtsL
LASIIALLSRLVSTIAEVVCVSIAYLSGGKQELTTQQDTTAQLTQIDDEENQQTVAETPATELASNIPIEGGVKGE